jgi:hypothetical protein
LAKTMALIPPSTDALRYCHEGRSHRQTRTLLLALPRP